MKSSMLLGIGDLLNSYRRLWLIAAHELSHDVLLLWLILFTAIALAHGCIRPFFLCIVVFLFQYTQAKILEASVDGLAVLTPNDLRVSLSMRMCRKPRAYHFNVFVLAVTVVFADDLASLQCSRFLLCL